MKLVIESLKTINKTAKHFLDFADNYNIIAFYGDLGAGKTTFIKAICNLMKIKDKVSSPTFSLVNEYKKPDGQSVYHFDFYRINDIEEAYDLGYEEYFYSQNLCLIEWPEKIEILLPENCLRVRITEIEQGKRLIETMI
ncbi:MAG: tRNA (adenosine(37)-N6)-threonylcarbamoyltransferase complex ATPase subunit type 1 TsaE [Chlorobi bacterium]|nr:tRNA (adenosine(37)-N6)-threonylcarbamoyltransferase complex ATPase subunit type 1 TsaE [Chlorobiota bacterium]